MKLGVSRVIHYKCALHIHIMYVRMCVISPHSSSAVAIGLANIFVSNTITGKERNKNSYVDVYEVRGKLLLLLSYKVAKFIGKISDSDEEPEMPIQ